MGGLVCFLVFFCRIPSPGGIEIPERWEHRNVVHSGRAEASEVGTAFEQVAWTTVSNAVVLEQQQADLLVSTCGKPVLPVVLMQYLNNSAVLCMMGYGKGYCFSHCGTFLASHTLMEIMHKLSIGSSYCISK